LVAGAAALREMGLISFPLPQWNRQTNVMWGRTFNPGFAAMLWGTDLGLVVTTRLTFAGTWSVLLLAIASRHADVGAAVLLLYWLGRAAQVWIAAVLVRDANDAPGLLQGLYQQSSLLQRIHVAGLIWAIAVLGFLMREGNPL
jgi:cytochrome c biogenesis protein CcdA